MTTTIDANAPEVPVVEETKRVEESIPIQEAVAEPVLEKQKEIQLDDLLEAPASQTLSAAEEVPAPYSKIRPPIAAVDDKEIPQEGRRQNLYLRQIPQCPVFEPTLEEFTRLSFSEYLIEAEKLIAPEIGVYKVSTV